MRRLAHRSATYDRGQTGIDFVVGVGVFLITVAFIFGFVPGMFSPFGDDPEAPLVADRIADELIYEALADEAGPSMLNTPCTVAFFSLGPDVGCPFEGGGEPANWLAVPNGYHLNVTVERDVDGVPGREILYWNGTAVTEPTDGNPLKLGEAPPNRSASVTTGSRVVHIDGDDAVVVVRIW